MKNLFFSSVEHFRYERKFFVEFLSAKEIEALIFMHPAIFRKIYYKREINNIYFDSFNMGHYFDNVEGADRRLKIRVRWYGDTFGFVPRPALEVIPITLINYPLSFPDLIGESRFQEK